MTIRIAVLDKDTTGKVADNLIQGEVHSPAPAKLRLVIPKWGAFFSESLVVVNAATFAVVDPQHYILGDVWEEAQLASGKDVRSCFLLKDTAPVDVEISYQAYGGLQSRNAQVLVEWLNEHLGTQGTSKDFKDLKDLPAEYQPSEHKHLLAHVFGMEYVVAQLQRLNGQMDSDRENQVQVEYENAKVRVARMAAAVDVTVTALLNNFWTKWKEQLSLYTLGVDLLKNYPVLGSSGSYAAEPAFAVVNESDERYVDIAGLGAFSRAMLERIVTSTTGLGLDLATQREAQRGSFIGALVGEVFYLPSPNEAIAMDYVNIAVYPKDWNKNHGMIVVKQMGHFGNYGGIFSAFDPVNGNQYIGVLANDTWKTPLVWQRVYHSDETTAIASALNLHITAKGAVHEEDKDQIGLGRLENLPVVHEDTIVTGESVRHLVTYDTLMAFVRVHQEAIKLARDSKGDVDYNDTMDKTRVIINSGACKIEHQPKDQFISSFCDGTDKYVRMSDGLGAYYDKLQESQSKDCGMAEYPAYGTKVSEYCEGVSLKTRYSDGRGNYFTEVTQMYSESCGYVKPLQLGTIISVFCSGTTQMTRYADGAGSTYDLPTQIDTYLCGGSIYPSQGSGDSPGGTPTPSVKTLKIASTHTKISKGTVEFLSFYATGLVPNAQYSFDLIVNSPAFKAGVDTPIYSNFFTASATGTFLWEQERNDDGVTTPRGDYQTWVTIESANLTSNRITRSFIVSDVAQEPDDTTNAGDGDAGTGGTGTGGKDVNGDVYGHPGQYWPPVPAYNPAISFATDRGTLFVGSNEILSVELRNFYAMKPYVIEFWVSHPEVNGGAPIKTKELTLTTASNGAAAYNLAHYDDGSTPRGMTQNWIEVKAGSVTIKSNVIDRQFAAGTDLQAAVMQLTVVTSHSPIFIGTSYSHSVVMIGGTPNTKYTIELRRTFHNATMQEALFMVDTAVVTTDGTGAARLDYSSTYDGVSPPPNAYRFYVRLAGIQAIFSNISSATFVGQVATSSDLARVTFSSTKQVLRKNDTEVMTAKLTNFPPNTTVPVEFWTVGASHNNGQQWRIHTGDCRTGSDGVGTLSIDYTDDGITVPRGDYETWAVTTIPHVISNRVTRTYMSESGTVPGTSKTKITYTTNFSTVSPGVKSQHTFVITELVPGSTNQATFLMSSPALNNGMAPIKPYTVSLTASSTGRAENTFDYVDDGITVPRGAYSCWIECAGGRSATVTIYFTGTPAPEITYNPKIYYSKVNTTLSKGTADSNVVDLSGMKPNTSYTIDTYMQGPNAFGNQPVKVVSVQILTDSKGVGNWQNYGHDDGVLVPRGSYNCWAEIPSLSMKSNVIYTNWIGTPPPTDPPFNPAISYYTDRYTLTVGTSETHTISITGMKSNTSYSVSVYVQSNSLWGGAATVAKTVSIQTDANGWGMHVFSAYDDGTAPRGIYSNWAVINDLGKASSVFTRVFQ